MSALCLDDLSQDFVIASHETCSPNFLEELIANERVHAIQGLADLDRRMGEPGTGLEGFRQLFTFRYKDTPAVYVTIAYIKGLPTQLQGILYGKGDLYETPDTAVPYAISKCKNPYTKGVEGLGQALLLRVREYLAVNKPSINTMATLSPLAGFRNWISNDKPWIRPEDGKIVSFKEFLKPLKGSGFITASEKTLKDWAQDPTLVLPEVGFQTWELKNLALAYSLFSGQNSVAQFHCGNGAFVGDIRMDANLSINGLRDSFGMMINYIYPPEPQRLLNAANFAKRHRAFCTPANRSLLQASL